MSIEVLTRRIERLKHHVQQLHDAGIDTSVPTATRDDALEGLVDGNLRLVTLSSASTAARAKKKTLVAAPFAQRLPNASFGTGASMVSRQRQALANAVQQAAARGVAQIRDELSLQETHLIEQLLQQYQSLCELLLEAPDPHFVNSLIVPNGSAADDSVDHATNTASHNTSSAQIDISDITVGTQGASITRAPSSASLQRSHSVVGLDSQQRTRNAHIEQLAVACQLLLNKKRKIDLLDAKQKEVDTYTAKFLDTLGDCTRLLRGGGSIVAVGGATPQGAVSRVGGGKLAPLPLRQQAKVEQLASSNTSGLSSAADSSGKTNVDRSNVKKVLQTRVNDAMGDLRMCVVRLLLYFSDLQGDSVFLDASSSSNNEVGASVLVLRRQHQIFERLTRNCGMVRNGLAEAPDFCPPSLGVVCSTPLLLDPAALQTTNAPLAGDESSYRGTSSVARRSVCYGLQAENDIPVADRRTPQHSELERNEASPAMRKKSISLAQRPSSSTCSSAQPLYLRSGKELDMLSIARALDLWKVLANKNNVDIPPTAVEFENRYVPPPAHRPQSPQVCLHQTLIDAYQPGLLQEITGGAGPTYGALPPSRRGLAEMREGRVRSPTHAHAFNASSTVEEVRGTEDDVIHAATAAAIRTLVDVHQPHARDDPDVEPQYVTAPSDSTVVHTLRHNSSTPIQGLQHEQAVLANTLANDDAPATPSKLHVAAVVPRAQTSKSNAARTAALLTRQVNNSRNSSRSPSPSAAPSPASPLDDEHVARGVRLAEIAKRLQVLQAHQRIARFVYGYVIGGKGSGITASALSVMEESVLAPYEAHHYSVVRAEGSEWMSDNEVRSLGDVLAQRKSAQWDREQHAATVIARFLRLCVAMRKNRERYVDQRALRRTSWAVCIIESWWLFTLPTQRAKRHATVATRHATRRKQSTDMHIFERLSAAVVLVQRVGRSMLARRSFGVAAPAARFELQCRRVRAALWYKRTSRIASQLRQQSEQRIAASESFEVRRRAAVKLQAFARRIIAQKSVRALRAQRIIERRASGPASILKHHLRAAACILQRSWRCCVARRTLSRKRAAFAEREARREQVAQMRLACRILCGFCKIIQAKRLRHKLAKEAAERRKQQKKMQRPHSGGSRGAMHAVALRGNIREALKNIDTEMAARQATAELIKTLAANGGEESALVQRQLQRVMKLDASSVPALELEGNFLSNTTQSSKTLEREDDSFEVRMLHRLLQAPTALLYVLSTFCELTSEQKPGALPASPAAPGEGGFEVNECEVSRISDAVVATDEDDEPESSPSVHGDALPATPMPRRLTFAEEESCSKNVPSGRPENSSATPPSSMCRWKSRPPTTSRITCRGGDLLLEDEHGAPRLAETPEPFAKWSLAHSLLSAVSQEASTYAWKMIFSHTAHDEQKQRVLSTEEERCARQARVDHRNQLILACYDCDSEAQWLTNARKNLGFVGRIWNPVRYLDQNDPDVEQRAIESYEFVEGFLMQCFPSAYSLRDVPELLVGCGLYFAMQHSLNTAFEGISPNALETHVTVVVNSESVRAVDRELRLSQQRRSSDMSCVEAVARRVAEGRCIALEELRCLADVCFTPTVTIAPSRRSVPPPDDDTEYGCDDDEDRHDSDEDRVSDSSMPQYAVPRSSADMDERDDVFPDRSAARLGFVGDDADDDADPTPATTSIAVLPSGVSSSGYGAMTPADTSDDMNDTQRDEEAKQLLLERYSQLQYPYGGPTPGDDFAGLHGVSAQPRDDVPDTDDDDLNRTGCGNVPIPDDDSSNTDASDGNGLLVLRVSFLPSVDAPVVTVEPPAYVSQLAERLATVMLDVRVDPQMFEEI